MTPPGRAALADDRPPGDCCRGTVNCQERLDGAVVYDLSVTNERAGTVLSRSENEPALRGGKMALVSIRRAEPADAPAIAEIHLAARREAMPYLPELHSDDDVRVWVGSVMLPAHTVWVAEIAGQVAGYAALDGEHLEHLYVRPGSQGRGVGSALLATAKAASPGGLSLYVFQRNARARAFYQARGFAPVEFGDGSGNEEGEPDARYAWRPCAEAPAVAT
jgi:ribosomal protein S18 acetylase RimI-like enzyme